MSYAPARDRPKTGTVRLTYFGVMEDDTVGPESATPRFPFDPVYKALCCHRRTLRDMLHGYLVEPHGPLRRELIAALDLDTLRKVSMEWVTRDFRLRRGDQVWQVAFTDAGRSRGYPAFLLVNLEFQSRRDGLMALRFLEQGGELVRELRAQEAIRETEPCPVLSVVLHNGRSPWTAPTAAAALVNMPSAFGAPPAVPADLAAFWPWGYWPLDFPAHADRPHVPGNVMSMIIGIEFARERSDLVAPLWETARNLGDDDLGDTVARWLRRLNERYNLDLPGMEELMAMQDVTVLTSRLDETIEEWRREAVAGGHAEGRAEGRAEGHAEGRAEGIARQRAMLCRQAERRFGSDTAADLSRLLADVSEPERLESIGDAIIDCESGDALIAAVSR